ncbi:MAG: AMP-binding protein [Oculatellaceae cyanobacterium Prado106]|jgi:acyl-CoA synthetase (AMP-forming)/AMP-acid ligase II|nr:AMP-binding protein [Oculatellaceae cyanobacterium Prado106]
MTNIASLLQIQAQATPHQLAIATPHRSISFADLETAVRQATTLLRRSHLHPGDTALVFQPMSVELYIVLLALFRVGMTALFIDPSAGLSHLENCCALCPPQALIASSKAHLLRLRSPALQQIPVKFAIGLPVPGAKRWDDQRELGDGAIAPVQPTDPALITFTSGSTGQPKAAVRSHAFLLAQHQVLAATLQLTPGHLDLTTLPIFGLANLASGVTSLIPNADLRFPGRIPAAQVIAQIQTHQPQSIAASPALLERLADYCEQNHLTLPSFQKIFSGGAPVFPQLLTRLQTLAPQAQVTAVYGSTEAEPIAHLHATDLQPEDRAAMVQGKGLLTGQIIDAIHLEILPDRWGTPLQPLTQSEFAALTLPKGAIGEIVVSGSHVLPSYLGGRGNAETKFQVEGVPWHRTGDAGYRDEQGRLWLLGRCSARIEDEQGVIYPFAVEAAALQDGVRRTALVSLNGQRVLVVEWERAIAHNPQQQQICLEELRRSLSWVNLHAFHPCPHIPVDKRHNAKIDYPALIAMLSRDSRGGWGKGKGERGRGKGIH